MQQSAFVAACGPISYVTETVDTGHVTVAVHRSNTAERAMPPWTDDEPSLDVVCKLCQRFNDVFPVCELDVVVVGIFHQANSLHLKPVVGTLMMSKHSCLYLPVAQEASVASLPGSRQRTVRKRSP